MSDYQKKIIMNTQANLLKLGFDPKGVDGIWGKNTESAYNRLILGNVDPSGIYGLKAIPWGQKFTDQELQKLAEVIRGLGLPTTMVMDFMACMAWETGEKFAPDTKNPASSACVDTDTEILTRYGWKKYSELEIGYPIYSIDYESGKMVEDEVLHLTIKESDENYSIKSRSFDSVSTHDHRWYLLRREYQREDRTPKIVVKTTEEIINLKSSYLYNVPHVVPAYIDFTIRNNDLPPELFSLLGLICGDGWVRKNGKTIELSCHAYKTPWERELIEECVAKLFGEVRVREMKGSMLRWTFNVEQSEFLFGFFDKTYNDVLESGPFVKKLSPQLMAKLDPQSAEALVKGYIYSDGHRSTINGRVSFRSTERAIMDDFMHAATLAGYNVRETAVGVRSGSLAKFPGSDKTYAQKNIYTAYLRKSEGTSLSRHQISVEKVDGPITVWCPTTKSGNWIARRGGTVYVTGNCGLIQFMAATARGLGTTVEKLAKMTVIEQLDYVGLYFKPYRNRIRNLGDIYSAIIWPAAVGKPDDFVLWNKNANPTQYKVNSGLDTNQDGTVTRLETLYRVRDKMVKGFLPQFVK